MDAGNQPVTRRHAVLCSGLVVLTLFVFAQVRNFDFVSFDDGAYITENKVVLQGLSVKTAVWAFSKDSTQPTANWHPLTWLSHLVDVSLFGLRPGPMHLVNLCLHAGNVLLLYLVMITATGCRLRSFFVAGLFAIHPLHVESVAWISERKDVLSTMFILVAIWSYLRWTDGRHVRWQLLSLTAFILSLLAKQMYVTLPFLLLVIDYWPLQRSGALLPANSSEANPSGWRRLCLEKWPWLLTTIVFCGVALFGQTEGKAVGALADYPFEQRIYNALIVYALYLKQTVWPFGLAVYYDYPIEDLFWPALPALLLLLLISAIAIRFRNRQPWLLTGWLWYVGTLVPVIGLVQIGSQRMADRYMYFPLIGLALAGVWYVAEKAAGRPAGIITLQRIGLAALIGLAVIARNQTSHWVDTMELFQHAVDVAESSLARTKLAFEHSQNGDREKAYISALRALDLDPTSKGARSLLGTMHLDDGQPEDAERCFRQTLLLHPDFAEAHYNLGLALVRQGRWQDGIKAYQQALELSPDRIDVRTNLGVAYSLLEEDQKAAEQFELVLQASPEFPQANFNYGLLLQKQGEFDLAVRHFQSVTQSTPEMWQPQFHLAEIYHQQGRRSDALRHARRAFELSSGAADTVALLKQIDAE